MNWLLLLRQRRLALACLLTSGAGALLLLAQRIHDLLAELNSSVTEQRRQMRELAHDLRGPLTRLLLRVDTLRQQGQHDPDLVAGLEADLETLLTLNQDLSALSEPVGHAGPRLPVTLEPLCRQIAACYGPERVIVELAPELSARVEPRLLERTLHNLIDNALSHGGPPVILSAQSTADTLTIQVDDAGRGEGSEPKQQPQQPGLGLAIARGFCRRHGGELHLQLSQLGGMQVQLRLPADASPQGKP